MRRFLPFAALLGVALLLGCQEQGSGPVEPDVLALPFEPQSDMPDPKAPCDLGGGRDLKGHCHGDGTGGATVLDLFNDPAFTCSAGAEDNGLVVGQVSWAKDIATVGEAALPAGDHVHFQLQLKGVAAGDYSITGNQVENGCAGVDIGTVKVKKNGKVVTPGILQFEFPVHNAKLSDVLTHVWVTVSGPGGDFRSTAFELVIPIHDEVQ